MEDKFQAMMTNLHKMLEIGLGKKIDTTGLVTYQSGLLGSPPMAGVTGGKKPVVEGRTQDVETPVVIIEDNDHKEMKGGGQNHSNNFAYRLLCPKFDGNGFQDWYLKLEQYFEAESVPDSAKIRVVMLHLEGKALQWHQFLIKSYGDLNQVGWTEYMKQMRERFAPGGFDDPFADLVALHQVETVEKYYEDFIHLLNQVQLPDDYVLSLFNNHLRIEIGAYVKLLQPKHLMDAFRLARHVEAMIMPVTNKIPWSQPKLVSPPLLSIPSRVPNMLSKNNFSQVSTGLSSSKNTSPGSLSPSNTKPLNINGARVQKGSGKTLSASEIEDRRRKGLCFWCAAKYTPGHKCPRTQLYQIMVEGVEEDGEIEEFLDCEESGDVQDSGKGENPVISLQAMWGSEAWETMKLHIRIGGVQCIALLDSGSTHNFISLAMVKRAGLGMSRRKQLKVSVADGNVMGTLGECPGVTWEVQNQRFETDFLVLPLKNCDVVLGIQWLSQLGTINWDFSALKMEFCWKGQQICLGGCQPEPINYAEPGLCGKILKGRMNSHNFADVFEEPKSLPPERGHDHRITLIDENVVVKVKPYRYPSSQKDEIEKMIQEMLAAGIIRESNSAFASPIVMVKKKDSSWRMCVDYRRLNQITVKDKFPMPVIEELLDELGAARIFFKLDLRSGYHQIKMWEPDIAKTAFRTHEGHYEFLVMLFGLTNAPATFQGLMNRVFKKLLRKSVLVFFDDILVYSADWESHLKHVKEVLEILRHHRLFAKLSKCCFGAKKIYYLGYVISDGTIAMDREKGYGNIAKPLTDLLRKDGWKWLESEEIAFQKLKEAICSAPNLALPDFREEFTIEADASDLGVGAMLIQKGKPLAFFSRSLGSRHQALSVYEKEMLAVLMAVKKWSSYLIGRHFKIRTDHKSLRFLAENQAVTHSQQKWVMKMMGYDYEVCYKKGINNVVANGLSRRPLKVQCKVMAVSHVSTDTLKRVANTWMQDSKLKKIIKELEQGTGKHSKYSWDGNQLKRKGKLVVGNDAGLREEFSQLYRGMDGNEGGNETTWKDNKID
ncbi:hypothetical protein GQ457_08G013440 [Hibiscus cannabinus]